MRSHSPGDFHRLPPAPLLPSVHPGPPPSCLILLGFSEKSQVTFFAQQGSCSLRKRRLQGPSGMSSARDGRGRAEQSRVRGRGGAGRVNVTAQFYTYTVVLAALPDSRAWTCGERGVLGAFGSWCEGARGSPFWGSVLGLGLSGPCNPMLGVCE